jgi:hypothetical protein
METTVFTRIKVAVQVQVEQHAVEFQKKLISRFSSELLISSSELSKCFPEQTLLYFQTSLTSFRNQKQLQQQTHDIQKFSVKTKVIKAPKTPKIKTT